LIIEPIIAGELARMKKHRPVAGNLKGNMDIFFEIHNDLPREGPGDGDSTRRAFSLLRDLPPNPKILDIGCGPGMQTLDLARLSPGMITAVDTHQPFLDELRRRAKGYGVSDRIITARESMFALPYQEHSFNLVWSEGAIYNMGFEKGLLAWRPLLKPGGYVAVTELSWIKNNPPEEVINYWKLEYPGMRSMQDNLASITATGYHESGHFVLPGNSWWDDYYNPIERRLSVLRNKYNGDSEALHTLDAAQKELEMYRKYSNWYGYVFYVMQKVD